MFSVKRFLIILLLALTITPLALQAVYVPSNQDTSVAPKKANPVTFTETEEYELLFENANFKFYYVDARDVIVVYDKSNGYTWKTGIDLRSKDDAKAYCETGVKLKENNKITEEEVMQKYCSYASAEGNVAVQRMNTLLLFEYYHYSGTSIQTVTVTSLGTNQPSSSVESTLSRVQGKNNHFVLEVKYVDQIDATSATAAYEEDLTINVYFEFTDSGIKFDVPYSAITGSLKENLSKISIAPYLGATGGQYQKIESYEYSKYFDPVEFVTKEKFDVEYGEKIDLGIVDGYTFIPDGPGALIRNQKYTVAFDPYQARIYGDDLAQLDGYGNNAIAYVPFKTASIPVFGMSVGDDTQNAFVAYATKGAEYMELISYPAGNKSNNINYNSTQANFIYQAKYQQIYSQSAAGFQTLLEHPNKFDISLNYEFLHGDGSDGTPEASYVGMAKAYRNYLIENNELNVLTETSSNIPVRIDFLMSDSEKSIFGYNNVVATTADDVLDMLTELNSLGINNVNSGLLGWQRDGLTLGRVDKAVFTPTIGSKSKFKKVIKEAKELNVDISFYQDYYQVNEEQVNLFRNVIKHASSWYSFRRTHAFTGDPVINQYYFARSIKSVQWFEKQNKTFDKLGVESYTIAGISNNVNSDYTFNTSRTENIEIIVNKVGEQAKDKLINAVQPNSYLFKYVDRYLDSPVYNSQFLTETDTVPFLGLVLQGSMELYGPYCNFSFYDQASILRMIDYNLYPSFMLTNEPAYLLSDTTASIYYSTEYSLYKDMIVSIYGSVSSALNQVSGATWQDRYVIENGFIVNTYSNGKKIYINYSNDVMSYNGITVNPLSFYVE